MFAAGMLVTAKNYKQPKCSSRGKWTIVTHSYNGVLHVWLTENTDVISKKHNARGKRQVSEQYGQCGMTIFKTQGMVPNIVNNKIYRAKIKSIEYNKQQIQNVIFEKRR